MKKIFIFSLFIFLFSLFFVKAVPSAYAATITCGPDSRYGETWTCDIKCGGTNGCFQTKACGSTLGSCITITATETTKCGATCTTSTYTCTDTPGQSCNDVTCATDGAPVGTGTCPPTRRFCCKPSLCANQAQGASCMPATVCSTTGGSPIGTFDCTGTNNTCCKPATAQPPPSPSTCAGTCESSGICTEQGGTISQTSDCGSVICCTGGGTIIQCPTCGDLILKGDGSGVLGCYSTARGPFVRSPTTTSCPNLGGQSLSCNGTGTSGGCKTDSADVTHPACMQCPAGYDTFWNCPFRVGDIPASETCCKRSGLWPLVSYDLKPLVSCSEASCTIPGGCPEGDYEFKCVVGSTCETAIGKLETTPGGFINDLFTRVLGIVGGIAVLLIIISGYRLMASQGNPEKVQGAKEQLTAAIVGLLFVIFSLVILQVIGYDILRLPGFGN